MNRSKTFTGCWTCRDRKVKCDEAKPRCNYCVARGYECRGYGVRLHWLPPQVGPTVNDPGFAVLSRGGLQRRQVLNEPPEPLDEDQMQNILKSIDAVEHSAGDGQFLENPKPTELTVGGFGVFQLSSPPRRNGDARQNGAVPISFFVDEVDELVLDDDVSSTLVLSEEPWTVHPYAGGNVGSDSIAEAAANLWNLYVRQSESEYPEITPHTPDPSSSASPSGDASSCQIDLSSNATSTSLTVFTERDLRPGSPASLSSSLDIFTIPLQEKYLLRYYLEKVVQLSCVIDNDKSPWKTIHLPRALQSIGQLTVEGSTSRIRHALRNDLLSISAFQLSNHHKFFDREDDATKWSRAASQYRCNAIGLLNQAMGKDLYSQSRPRYKDFLATMLSMLSINVMSGDTESCSVHLDGAGQLICHMGALKTKYSPKAMALHRIYYYLRLIYESTAVNSPSFHARYPMLADDDLSTCRNSLNLAERDDMTSGSLTADKTRMSTYEYMYGIPRDLLKLLRRSIAMVDLVDDFRAKNGDVRLPEDLDHYCNDVERDILDYAPEDHLARLNLPEDSVNSRIIMQQTRAFHNAIIIYFSQNVRLFNHRYLRQYIEAIIESIEEIEQIKADTLILAAPLFWPAFIGASEAYDERFQARYRGWYNRVAIYGIEAVRTGTRVLDEVWRMGPPRKRTTSAWRMALQRTGHVLMLT